MVFEEFLWAMGNETTVLFLKEYFEKRMLLRPDGYKKT